MDDINPRAVIGGNEPPLADRLALDHADLVKRAAEKVALVPEELRAIQTDEEAQAYTDTAADIKKVLKEADDAFEPEKEPWLTGSRTVDNFFAFRASLKSAAQRAVNAVNAWQTAQLAKKRRAEAEEAERAREEAIAFDEPVVAFVPHQVVVKEAVRVVSASGNRASASVKWEHRVIDRAKVPRQYMKVNDDAIIAAIKGGVREIKGVEIYEAVKTAIRR